MFYLNGAVVRIGSIKGFKASRDVVGMLSYDMISNRLVSKDCGNMFVAITICSALKVDLNLDQRVMGFTPLSHVC